MSSHSPNANSASLAGIVLCGGRSTRMGYPKALLPFGPECILQRVVKILGEVASPIIIVAAADQELPALPGKPIVVHDREQGRGPLEGLRAGLAALPAHCDAAYVTSCDAPLLTAAFIARVAELRGDHDAAVPVHEGYHHPLAAVYRRAVLPVVESLLAANRLRPFFLFEQVRTREINSPELHDVDPLLLSLRNLNHPADYFSALATAGFEVDAAMAEKLQGKDEG